jgi:hypothetical protein
MLRQIARMLSQTPSSSYRQIDAINTLGAAHR